MAPATGAMSSHPWPLTGGIVCWGSMEAGVDGSDETVTPPVMVAWRSCRLCGRLRISLLSSSFRMRRRLLLIWANVCYMKWHITDISLVNSICSELMPATCHFMYQTSTQITNSPRRIQNALYRKGSTFISPDSNFCGSFATISTS